MKKRLLAMFLALVMCLALLPTAALAGGYDPSWDVAYPVPGGELHFDTKRGYITGCTPGVVVADIPDAINGVAVTAIYNYAFGDCAELTTVNIPESVTVVWEVAFSVSVATPPESLREINVAPGNKNFASIDGVLFDKEITELIRFPLNKQCDTYNIPEGVTKIHESAFSHCSAVNRVAIPSSVTDIENDAFWSCTSLTSVTFSPGLTSIGDHAFYGCSGLTSLTFPNSMTSIEHSAFDGCSNLTSVTIPDSVTSIGQNVFWDCTSLKDVYYGGSEAQWKAIKSGDFGDFREDLTDTTIHYNSTGPSNQPTTPDKPVVPTTALAIPTNDELTVDGQPATPAAYKIDGTNYFKLRDVAVLLGGTKSQFSVDWDASANAAAITTGQPYTRLPTDLQGKPTVNDTASLSGDVIYINGVKADLTIYKINGDNYFKLLDLGKALGFNVGWAADRGMFIESDKPYDPNN